ncbi:Flp pilus assembly protein CpaB [Spongiactinospora sp. TRM90649]|uniref:Flp pilus assembly protein CpaB n=1 Tax=Spongiactinospora sp. TRM90649 TaxID=3031114 RepID=UPI0023F9ABBD|nr:Flp pilus assembly protein CpaB [Spongiactinospora sp. TRM90649]MDF5757612.1 Flp pilus assembly protein CpaB [Spongiactinospora sp. TRM90649]
MQSISRALIRHRRLVAASLTATAVACALIILAPSPPLTVSVLTAARDLRSGPIAPGDLIPVPLPTTAVPAGAVQSPDRALGKTLAAPMRRGEPLTDVRLVGPPLVSTHIPGTIATPVRIADADAAALLTPGDTIDVLAARSGEWNEALAALPAQTVADDVRVIAAPRPPTGTGTTAGGSAGGALLVLATTQEQAAKLAAAQATGRLSITIGPQQQP